MSEPKNNIDYVHMINEKMKKNAELEQELTQLRKCKEALEAMLECPLIKEAGFVPYIESVLGLRDDYVIRRARGE